MLLAVCSGNIEAVAYLVEYGQANVQDCSFDGVSCLHRACMGGDADMIKYLVNSYASVDVVDNMQRTPLGMLL